jgi:hypothetical protein
MPEDQINYPYIIDQAMRGVVREVLRKVQAQNVLVGGAPSGHHFFISYATQHTDVRMSEQLRAKYPKEITIVMQHQFWDFKVEDSQFHVTMSFGGVPEKLTVPFAALTAFADPSVKFGLQFQPPSIFGEAVAEAVSEVKKPAKFTLEIAEVGENGADGGEEKIISLDAFRKK